jgi:hypothetical protein
MGREGRGTAQETGAKKQTASQLCSDAQGGSLPRKYMLARHPLPERTIKNRQDRRVERRKRLSHVGTQSLAFWWGRRFRLPTDFFSASDGRGSDRRLMGSRIFIIRLKQGRVMSNLLPQGQEACPTIRDRNVTRRGRLRAIRQVQSGISWCHYRSGSDRRRVCC